MGYSALRYPPWRHIASSMQLASSSACGVNAYVQPLTNLLSSKWQIS